MLRIGTLSKGLTLALTLLVALAFPVVPAFGQGAAATLMSIDAPIAGATFVNGVQQDIGGRAADTGSMSGTGIDQVRIYLDGQMNASGTLLGTAAYGKPRTDVATALANPNFTNSGFDLLWTPTTLSSGDHTIYVYAHATNGDRWSYKTVSISGSTQNAAPSAANYCPPGGYGGGMMGGYGGGYGSMMGGYAGMGYGYPGMGMGYGYPGMGMGMGYPGMDMGYGSSYGCQTSNSYQYGNGYSSQGGYGGYGGGYGGYGSGYGGYGGGYGGYGQQLPPPPIYIPVPVPVPGGVPPVAVPLTAPTGLTLGVVTRTSVTLSWLPVPGATSYQVMQSGVILGPFTPSAGGQVPGTTATIVGLTPITFYTFEVVAIGPTGTQSPPSNTVTTVTPP